MKSNFAIDGRTHTWPIYIEPWLILWKREWVEALFFSPEIRRDKFEYRKTKSEMQDWLVAQKIVQEILKEDEKKKEQLQG